MIKLTTDKLIHTPLVSCDRIVMILVILLAFGVSSLQEPPLNVKEHIAPVLPLLFFLLASNVEALYRRKGIPQMGLGGKQGS